MLLPLIMNPDTYANFGHNTDKQTSVIIQKMKVIKCNHICRCHVEHSFNPKCQCYIGPLSQMEFSYLPFLVRCVPKLFRNRQRQMIVILCYILYIEYLYFCCIQCGCCLDHLGSFEPLVYCFSPGTHVHAKKSQKMLRTRLRYHTKVMNPR